MFFALETLGPVTLTPFYSLHNISTFFDPLMV